MKLGMRTLIVGSLLWTSVARGEQTVFVKLVRATESTKRISELTLETNAKIEVYPHSSGVSPNAKTVIELKGNYTNPNATLLIETSKVDTTQSSDHSFSVRWGVSRLPARIELNTIGLRGEVETEYIMIRLIDEPKKMSHPFSPSLGISMLHYTEGTSIDFSEIATTVKLGYRVDLKPPRFDLGINAFFTAFALSSTLARAPSGFNNVSVKYLGFNAKVGYLLYQDPSWRIALYGGGYYTTMFVTGNSFGFNNLSGPQLFPVVSTFFGSNSLSAYLKFSPVGEGFNIASLSDREIAGGISYAHSYAEGNSISLHLDISQLSITVGDIPVTSSSTSFSVGYDF